MLDIAAAAEAPHDLAVRIIAATPAPIYTAKGQTDEEAMRAAGHNAAAQLREFMLSPSVPEAIRVCYAIAVLDDQLLVAQLTGSPRAPEYREEIMRDRGTLAAYLKRLNGQSEP